MGGLTAAMYDLESSALTNTDWSIPLHEIGRNRGRQGVKGYSNLVKFSKFDVYKLLNPWIYIRISQLC